LPIRGSRVGITKLESLWPRVGGCPTSTSGTAATTAASNQAALTATLGTPTAGTSSPAAVAAGVPLVSTAVSATGATPSPVAPSAAHPWFVAVRGDDDGFGNTLAGALVQALTP
jgi:hypothetical protein